MSDIRILFYTDLSFMVKPGSTWSITSLMSFVKLKSAGVTNVSFELLYRDPLGDLKRLDRSRLKGLHELWIFGFNAVTDPPYTLDSDEIDAVSEWMDKEKGGVLITGDHSITESAVECDADHRSFAARGRSIGSCIPRARQMRDWEGPPTACDDVELSQRDNYNTQVGDDPEQLDSLLFQSDEFPQTLLPEPQIHPLFRLQSANGSEGAITKFPDHQHEGKLRRLDALDDEWPKPSPLPKVVARGTDKRFPAKPRIYDLVSAYDGDQAGVGRIVADSSFHHYIDMNLSGFRAVDCLGQPVPGSDLDEIAQYYWNLVYWLAPIAVRRAIQLNLFMKAAFHPDVLELWGTGNRQLGDAGHYILEKEVGQSNLSSLFSSSAGDDVDLVNEFLQLTFLKRPSAKFSIEPAIALGSTIKMIHKSMQRQRVYDPTHLRDVPRTEHFIIEGLKSLDTVAITNADLAELERLLRFGSDAS